MSFNKTISDTSIRLGPVRFSFVNVLSPRKKEDGTPGKYGVCVLFPKADQEAYKIFQQAYENARQLGKASKWNGRIPSKVQLPLHDGDEDRPDDPAFQGMWYFNCSSTNKPGVRVREDGAIVEALDSEDFYSGCYGCASINFFAYNSSGSQGIGAGLNNVIKTRDGEKLSGGHSAMADFADLAGDLSGLNLN
jgi:hypothetical protein